MDIATALLCAPLPPAEFHPGCAVFPGAVTPIVVPLHDLPSKLQNQWIISNPHAALCDKLHAAFQTDNEAAAWTLLDALPSRQVLDPQSDAIIRLWSAKTLANLQTSLPLDGRCIFLGAPLSQTQKYHIRTATQTIHELFSSLLRPAWIGPVLIEVRSETNTKKALLVTDTYKQTLSRPVLPALHVVLPDKKIDAQELQQMVAQILCRLTLQRLEKPDAPWPQWIQVGMELVAAERCAGTGPSPRAMRRIRQTAGNAAIVHALQTGEATPDLAKALCEPLLHSKRRHHLSSLLDLLRNGTRTSDALRIAYGITPKRYISAR